MVQLSSEERPSPEALLPTSLRRDGDRLVIEWSDGVKGVIPFGKLRDACPCASCIEKRSQPPNPLQILSDAEVKAGAPVPVAMPARGAYAYQIVWNDGHDTGIYRLEILRQLCEAATR
jgi:DUF971 family protein